VSLGRAARRMAAVAATMALALGAGLFTLLAHAARPAADVDAARLGRADQEPGNWMSQGRTYGEQRHSPLKQITAANVQRLGLAWFHDLDTAKGQEATPLVIDGVMYVSTAWSLVKAFDARSGRLLCSYDPQVPRDTLVKGCCDAVNRGVAAWRGRVFVGTLDGRLVALMRPPAGRCGRC
jgi:quinohemoprotein ethanol dehydrogenase